MKEMRNSGMDIDFFVTTFHFYYKKFPKVSLSAIGTAGDLKRMFPQYAEVIERSFDGMVQLEISIGEEEQCDT